MCVSTDEETRYFLIKFKTRKSNLIISSLILLCCYCGQGGGDSDEATGNRTYNISYIGKHSKAESHPCPVLHFLSMHTYQL